MACWRLSRPSTIWPFAPERHVEDRCVVPFRSLCRPAFRHGQSLASPLSSGVARMLNNNYSLYAALDQPLWQESEGAGGLDAFLRVMGAPAIATLSISISIRGLPMKARSGERTTRSAAASPIHGSAARRARSMPIRPRRRRPIRCDRAKGCWRLATNSRSPAGGSCSPISSTSSTGRRHS